MNRSTTHIAAERLMLDEEIEHRLREIEKG
jgi:hypothetical protein